MSMSQTKVDQFEKALQADERSRRLMKIGGAVLGGLFTLLFLVLIGVMIALEVMPEEANQGQQIILLNIMCYGTIILMALLFITMLAFIMIAVIQTGTPDASPAPAPVTPTVPARTTYPQGFTYGQLQGKGLIIGMGAMFL